ncbi:MAG TPA: CocE/NonD family hydrolase [Acidimicrobiales bacterium]|nr:CocE/NonD family hydrolase [Acidimicrobiales bacterium]
MEHRFPSDGNLLAADLVRPPTRADVSRVPAVVLVHGYPSDASAAVIASTALPELAERIAAEMGWVAMALQLRGCGDSEGSFSLRGWLDDLLAAVDHLAADESVSGVWLAGFGTGGALSICAAAANPAVRGVAALGAPADFDDWASNPRRVLEHAREVGLIRDPAFPPSVDQWSRELRELRAVAAAPQLAPRPLLVVHGSDDDLVPVFDARVIVDAHGSAELRIVYGAGHRLRHDPRAVAVLLGWLDRTRHQAPV